MQPLLNQVVAQKDYTLILRYENNESRLLDMKPLLSTPPFDQLNDLDIFCSVKTTFDTIEWKNNIDIDPEYIYIHSIIIDQPL